MQITTNTEGEMHIVQGKGFINLSLWDAAVLQLRLAEHLHQEEVKNLIRKHNQEVLQEIKEAEKED